MARKLPDFDAIVAEHDPGKKQSQWKETWRLFRSNKLALVGMIIILVLILVAIFADLIAPYDPAAADFSNRLAFPSLAHPLGTDNYGRDLLSRIIFGARVSLTPIHFSYGVRSVA